MRFMSFAASAALCFTGTSLTAAAAGPVDDVIAGRLAVSEFMRICVRTDGDPAAIDSLAAADRWERAVGSDLTLGLLRAPEESGLVMSFTRSLPVEGRRQRSRYLVVPPTTDIPRCTVQFENVSFDLARTGLVASGYEIEEDVPSDRVLKRRVESERLCRETGYRQRQCIDLAVDPASFPRTGQLDVAVDVPSAPLDDEVSGSGMNR